MYKFLMKALVIAAGVVIGNLVTEQVKERARLE